MKRLYISIIILLGFLVSFGQTNPPVQTIGVGGNIVVAKGFLGFDTAVVYRTSWADTTSANLNPYLKYQRGAQIRQADTIWQRSQDLTRWFRTGAGSLIVDTTNTIQLSGNGAYGSPLTANAIISGQQGNALQSTGAGLFVPNFIQDGIIIPGVVTWVSGYTYEISPATYVIGGVQYTSPYTTITLDASHATLNRIDLFAVNTSGAVVKITGTPATDPQEPSVNPATQIKIGFVLVTAGTTQPSPTPSQDWIYINNAEWTTVTSHAVRLNTASTVNPYSAPLDVEGTTATNNDFVRFTSITPPTISNFNVLTFKIRSKSAWASNSRIGIRWYSGGTPIGTEVALASGSYGFASSQTSSYQIVSIPLYSFGSLVSPTALLMTIRTTGFLSIGFYIDDIQLQQGTIPVAGNFWAQGGNIWGTTGIFGTNDNNSIAFKSNNVERFRLLSSGQLLVGATSTVVNYPLQVTGRTKSTEYMMGGWVMTESGSTITETTSGFSKNTTYGTNGAATHTLTNGSFSINKSQEATAVYIFGASQTSAGMGNISIGSQTANAQYSATVGTVNGYNVGTLLYNTLGDVTLPSGTSYGISMTFNNQANASNTNSWWIQDYNGVTNSFPLLLKKTGQFKFGKYGVGSFTAGTPTYGLAVTADGTIIESPVGGGISGITADNGLTANTSTNVQLGGTLLQNTTVNTAGFTTTWTGTYNTGSPAMFNVLNVGTGTSFAATNNGGDATMSINNSGAGDGTITASSSGNGINATSTTGLPGRFRANPSSTNTTVAVGRFIRGSSGTPAASMGGAIELYLESTSADDRVANQLISQWTIATDATRTSQFIITGVNSAVTSDLFTLSGSGSLKLNKYGINTFAGTAAYTLGVDASGNVVETAAAGTGTVNSGTINTLAYYPATGTTVDDASALTYQTAVGWPQMIVTGSAAEIKLAATGAGGHTWRMFATSTAAGFSQANTWALFDETVSAYRFSIDGNGNVAIGAQAPTAALHIKAGTATANTAPLKFSTGGAQLLTPENGVLEPATGDANLLFTAGSTRYTIAKTLTNTAILDFASTGSGAVADLTITVTGAADGDAVVLGTPNGSITATATYSAWVSAANTVTVRFSPKATEDPASGTFRVSVIKY